MIDKHLQAAVKEFREIGFGNTGVGSGTKPMIYLEDWLTKTLKHYGDMRVREVCICAAVKTTKGVVWRGQRHGDCMRAIVHNGFKISKGKDAQGFVTSKGRFVTREQGRKLQNAAGILSADPEGYTANTLFSEDLY